MIRRVSIPHGNLLLLGMAFFCHSISVLGQNYFTPNEGQWEGDFLFTSKFGSTSFYLGEDYMGFTQLVYADHDHSDENNIEHLHGKVVGGHHYRMRFLDGNSQRVSTQGQSDHYENFFIGHRSKWRSRVQPVESVTLYELYPGIDLQVYSRYGQLKYDLLAKDAADLAKVKIYYEGVESVEIIDERIHVRTSVGEVIEIRPYAYVPESKKAIEAHYVLSGDTLRFELDPSYEGPVTLDPTFIFSTFTGSVQDNWGYSATYHPLDSTVFAAGIGLNGGRYPLTPGAFDTTYVGRNEIAISKFTANGKSMIYSTYLGGLSVEQPGSIVCDTLGRLAILGTTSSLDFPTTSSAIDTTHNGGPSVTTFGSNFPYNNGADLFVTVLAPDGASLVGSTFMGGTNTDGLNRNIRRNYGDENRGEIIVSANNTLLIATSTNSDDVPVVNAFQPNRVDLQEAWVFEMSMECDTLLWSTYYGGPDQEAGFSVRNTSDGTSVYLCGSTTSSSLPGTNTGAVNTNNGKRDGFIALFSGPSRTVQSATFNGTQGDDMNFLMDIKNSGEVYVIGQTDSIYPTPFGLIAETNASIYIQEIDPLLSTHLRALTFGNKLPNSVAISPTAFAVDDCGDLYLSGWGGVNNQNSSTRNMHITGDAYQDTTDGSDLYFAVIDASFRRFNYATYFGGLSKGEHVDGGTSRFDSRGVMYQAICADCGSALPSNDYPTFPNDVHSRLNGSGNCNLAVTVIAFEQQEANVELQAPDTVCSPFELVLNTSIVGADYVIWDFGGGDQDTSDTVPFRVYNVPGTYSVTVIALDTNCLTSDTATVEFEVVNPMVTADFQISYDPCDDFRNVQLTPLQGSGLFYWDFGDGNRDTSSGPISHTYGLPGTYTIVLVAEASNCFGGSSDTLSQSVEFIPAPDLPEMRFYYNGCASGGEARLSSDSQGWQIFEWDLSDGQQLTGEYVVFNAEVGTITVTLTVTDTLCNRTMSITETFEVLEDAVVLGGNMPNVFSPDGDGVNDFFQFKDGYVPSSLEAFSIKIYDRWGKLLWEGNTASFRWNGTVDDKPLTEGVYFWVINAASDCGSNIEEHGSVQIFK